MPTELEQKRFAAVLDMAKRQGGYCNIADIRKAAGLKQGDALAKMMMAEGLLLWKAHDLYKLVTTEAEAEQAKRDAVRPIAPKPKARRGIGSY